MTAGNRWHKVFGTVAVCVLCLALGACSFGDWFPESSGVSPKETLLDPADPVQVELWTYYTGAQQRAFEASLEEFNATRGRDVGVVAVHVSQGSISDLSVAVTDAARGLVGAHDMPDAFLSYPDTASVVDGLGGIADLSGYFSDEERDAFVDAFLAEGDLDGDGGIKLVPVGKSTETLQINMTDWQKFSEATGAGLDDLRTVEGITATAGRYYRWTDANTPDVADDGLPFFGRDALANYLLTGSRQLGHDILTVSDGKAEMTIDEETIRTLWDNYYVPLMNGYFSDEGRFRSDAVKTGELICFVGSTSSAVYFPTSVTVDDSSSYPIEFGALPAPVFEDGVPCAMQQGAGFAVAKSDERSEQACVEFLKWFTAQEHSTAFAMASGYVPVTKDALDSDSIEAAAKGIDPVPANYLANLPATLETIESGTYMSVAFENGFEARTVLSQSLGEWAAAGQEHVSQAVAAGMSRQEAAAALTTDESFEAWLAALKGELQTALDR